ncbi:hypothetical protein AXF42_Ash004949 [Apostasia shenzhenica]|uniref:DUF632 domain-containing protein n=1 Tax=Apostasia shenzhenica TaxID=1088818 RepID=A0A2I0B831_9ASPA|nr:hypothetical protein AXF42_Ash004949 [Apostasia shenzhenica]
MGCSASKLEDEEAVQLCRDRRNFIKQAVEQRNRFASGHLAYIESMRRVSVSLLRYVEAEDHYLLSDSYNTPPFTPVKRLSPEITGIPLKSFTATPDEKIKSSFRTVNYLRSGGNPSILVEELPEVDETVRIESFYPVDHYGVDSFFSSQASPVNTSSPSFFSSPFNRISHQPQSPQASSQWDCFWNPFSSLDPYGYPLGSSFDRIENDEDMVGLRQVREAEGIPELEEDLEDDDDDSVDNVMFWKVDAKNETPKTEIKHTGVQVGDDAPASSNGNDDIRKIQEVKELKSREPERVEASATRNAVDIEVLNRREVAGSRSTEETPGFTVYVNRRPGSMAEVMKDVENQFRRICECAHEISVMLEATRAQYSPASNELAVRMLNPVALFGSTSSRSSSSRFLQSSSAAKGDGYDSSSDYSEECCMISGSHQSTLGRLYAWEKKLYEEVKSGERVRIAYEKKCMQLRSHDINGEEPFVVDKTRTAIRDLHTRLKVSINTVQSISKRIEALRDTELYPQLMELIQGLSRMWKTMADCHQIQKQTIDEAKLLFAGTGAGGASTPPKPPKAAAGLAADLRNWRSCLANWIEAQRCYAKALAGWASRCLPEDACDASGSRKVLSPLSPRHDGGAGEPPPAFRVCIRWSRLLESLSEAPAVDGLDFFAAGVASVSAQQREAMEAGGPPEAAAAAMERVAEVGPKVLCAGLAVAVGSLAEHAIVTAEGYDVLVRRCRGGDGEGGAET